MGIAIVKFDNEEKKAIKEHILGLKQHYSNKSKVVVREYSIIESIIKQPIPNAPKEWMQEMLKRKAEWEGRIKDADLALHKYDTCLSKFESNKPVNFQADTEMFNSLYQSERSKKHVDTVYNYYPRLKAAKEKTLHVFAEKIKILMESENVKIA